MGVIREELSQADISDATKRVSDLTARTNSSDTDSAGDDTTPSGNPVADFYRRLRKRTSPKRS